ncbi:concanavalin A-like lectin/glucanase domain-containing protein [Chytriomyces cf. hyalinus JEL632]|nr:concanavalin A-like lectin/glucanase domain-containing protein [Chytriomyces cf. hyalinus JEL632]
MKAGAVSKSDAIASSNKGEEYFQHLLSLLCVLLNCLCLGALCGGITAAKPTTAAAKPTTSVTPTTPKVPEQPAAPGKTVTSAYGAPPAYATKFPIIECDKTKTCYKRNTFLIPAWGGISSNIQESGDMSFGLGRFYLVDAAATTYKQFYLNNRQISFTTDLSGIKCGQNSALYFSAMPVNLGSTYCDGQNTCMEMDILEGNIASSQVTTHECTNLGQVNGNNCNHNGCAAGGSTKFATQVGPNSAVINTLKPFKVTTKFITSDNTDQGTLTNIVQVFEQEGRKFETGNINKGNCVNDYGNVAQMGRGQQAGMTLILSYWEAGNGGMDWLDGGSSNPKCKSAGNQPAKYSNIRVEPIA